MSTAVKPPAQPTLVRTQHLRPLSCHHLRKRPAGCEFSRWRGVCSLSRGVSPCRAVDRHIALSTTYSGRESRPCERCGDRPLCKDGHGRGLIHGRATDQVGGASGVRDRQDPGLDPHPQGRHRLGRRARRAAAGQARYPLLQVGRTVRRSLGSVEECWLPRCHSRARRGRRLGQADRPIAAHLLTL